MKKILVPVDLSDGARRALRMAGEVARQLGARLEVVYVVQQPNYTGDFVSPVMGGVRLADFIKDEAEKELKAFVEGTAEAADLVDVRRVRFGAAPEKILKHAEESPPDLIVMGTRGRTGLAHILVGSVAERVLRHSRCPVLVVPAPRAA